MIQKPAWRSTTSFGRQASQPLTDALSRCKYPALLFLFTVTVFWKLIFSSEYSLLVYTDSSFQTYPWSQYLSEVLHQWSFPFWDMYADGGRSFIGEMQTGAFYPLNVLMGLLPRNAKGLLPVSLIEGFVILHAFLASLFMYGLATHFGLNRFSAFVAGTTFAFSGSVGLRAFAQVNLFYASVWVPAVFWCYAKSLQARELSRQVLFANLAGLALALSLLAGHHQPFIYMSLAIGGIASALWLRSRNHADEALCRPSLILRQTLLLFVFAIAYASLQLLPSLEYSKLAYRWVESVNPSLVGQRVPYSIVGTDNLLPPHGLILMLFPYLSAVENSPYLGILPLLMVLFSLLLLKKQPVVKLAFGLALVSALLSIGHFSPLHGLAYALIPGFDKGREASRIFLLAHFGLSLLAGFGCQVFLDPAPTERRKIRAHIVLAFATLSMAVCLIAFATYFYQRLALSQDPDYGTPAFACLLLLAASVVGLARSLGLARAKSLHVVVVLILLFDFHYLLSPHIRLKAEFDRKNNFEPKQYYSQDDVIQFLQSHRGPFRVDFRDDYYPKNSGEVFKLETINGYGATSLKQFYHFQAEAYPAGNVITDMLNVRYVVSQRGLDLPVAFQGEHAKVYENNGFLQRAWLAAQVEVKQDFSQMLPLLRDPSFDPYRVAYVEQPLGDLRPLTPQGSLVSEPASAGPVDRGTALFTRESPNRFRVETLSPGPRLLVVSQNWYPGWKAWINGESRPVERVNGTLMGVQVEAGASQAEFIYRPTGFIWALGMTVAALGVLAFSAFRLRSESRLRSINEAAGLE
jgi:membrane protein YfhO